jgi:hypothetical protein
MAGFFEEVQGGFNQSFFGNPYLRDPQHASKIFRTNGYGNAPKLKFLFHVYFEINDTLVSNNSASFPDKSLPGLLVKNISLPKYNIQLAEMNQYNRKRYVQTKINYDPVSISFHDDALGAIKKVWHHYYSYYFNDTNTAFNNSDNINTRTTYSPDITQQQNWGYLGEPTTSLSATSIGDPKPYFFKRIRIFGFNQHSFSCYNLINPMIERFEHDTYDYSAGTGVMENKMTVRYETVTYEEGGLNGENPSSKVPGFGTDQYYDKTLSPITRPGSNRTVMGPGGLVDAGDGIINDLSKVPPDVLGAIQKAGTAANTFSGADLKNIIKSEVLTGITGAITPTNVRSAWNWATSKVQSNTTSTSTQAPPVSNE